MSLSKKVPKLSFKLVNKYVTTKSMAGVFTLLFAITGGVLLLLSSKADSPPFVTDPIHHAFCSEVTPSKTVLAPGENFTGTVQIYNNGSSTYAPGFGVYLEEFRTGGRIWNPSGLDLGGNIPPGGYARFNLSLKAPTTPGIYSFDWGMAIVMNGFIHDPCYGPSITVTYPPSVTVLANSANSNITLTKGAGLTIGWSASNNPSICTASGTWGGGKVASGSENRNGDTATSGTKTYTLTCSNGAGSSSASRTVTVNNPPPTPVQTNPTPSSPNNSGSTSPKTSTPSSTAATGTKKTTATSGGSSQPAPTAPGTPDLFSSSNVNGTTVRLSWKNPAYNGLTGYELERSKDNKAWDKVGKDGSTEETYDDATADFGTTYYYRLRLLGPNDLKSDYANTQITTELFKANVTSDTTTLTSEDGLVSVDIPKDAIDQEASCNLRSNNDVLPPTKDKYVTLAGPYEILCKTSDGTPVKSFKSSVTVTTQVKGSYSAFSYYTLANDWLEIPAKPKKSLIKLELTDQTTFALLAKKNTSATIIKVIIGLAVLCGAVIGGLYLYQAFTARRERQKIEALQEDYFRKEHGIN